MSAVLAVPAGRGPLLVYSTEFDLRGGARNRVAPCESLLHGHPNPATQSRPLHAATGVPAFAPSFEITSEGARRWQFSLMLVWNSSATLCRRSWLGRASRLGDSATGSA